VHNFARALWKPQPRYIGQVTTGCCSADLQGAYINTVNQAQAKAPQKMMVNTPWIQIVYGAWGAQGDVGENAPGATTTVTASIEYPIGTFRRVTFNGSNTGSMASGTNLTSDAILDPPPKGAAFFVWTWQSCAGGVTYHYGINLNTQLGEACEWGTTVTDRTASGGALGVTGNLSLRPLAIIGPTTMPSVGIYGDSRTVGVSDSFVNNTYDIGEIARSIGPYFPYIAVGATGDSAAIFNTNHTHRSTTLPWVSHVISEYGINDVADGYSVATTEANLQTLWGILGKRGKTYQATLSPISSSTDNWATIGNQTTDGSNANRVLVNNWIRGMPIGIDGYFDVADALETARDSGKWIVNGTANFYVAEGIHETFNGTVKIQTAEVIRRKRIRF
jgi:hypothetical protein